MVDDVELDDDDDATTVVVVGSGSAEVTVVDTVSVVTIDVDPAEVGGLVVSGLVVVADVSDVDDDAPVVSVVDESSSGSDSVDDVVVSEGSLSAPDTA